MICAFLSPLVGNLKEKYNYLLFAYYIPQAVIYSLLSIKSSVLDNFI